jgi:outer membrane protein assembly factor BamB
MSPDAELKYGAAVPRRKMLLTSFAVVGVAACGVHSSSEAAEASGEAATQWWTWRGPHGNNVAAKGTSALTQYDHSRIVWTASVPGRGHSSPIVARGQIYLTTADKEAGTQSVLAYSQADGKLLWNQTVHRGGIPAENHPKNTEASSTVAFDGERLFCLFYNDSAIWLSAYSPDGKLLWQQSVGAYNPQTYKYGYAASPAIYENMVIVVGDWEGESFLAAHDRATGNRLWKVPRKNLMSFSSPIVAHVAGRDQLLLSGGESIDSYDPRTGKVLWSASTLAMATCGTLVWEGDLVFGSGGYPKSETACVRADGSGQVVWTNPQKCYEQSMLVVNGYVYAVTDAGVAHCWRASDGEVMWRERLGGDYSSSPVLVGEAIHVFNEQGQGFVFKATPERYESLGGGKIADDVFPTPTIVGDHIYMRVGINRSGVRKEFLVALK